jgi:hypothetical protein
MAALDQQQASRPRRLHALRPHLLALALYLVPTLYLLARVLPQFGSAIPGAGVAREDGWQNTWNLWWTLRALAEGQNPFSTNLVYYPEGAYLYLHTLNITNGLLTLPVQLVAGPVAAYNAAVVLGFVLTGYFSYLLARYLLGGAHWLAWAAGALVTFSPFHVSKLWDGHLSWVTLQWVPLYVLCLLLALERGRLWQRLLAGLVLAVAALTSWYYALFGLIFTALLALVRLPGVLRAGRWRSELTTLVLVGVTSLLLLSPILLPTLGEYLRGSYPGGGSFEAGWSRGTSFASADPLDYLFPSFLHPLWGQAAADLHAQLGMALWFWTISPGISVLVLAAVGSVACWRQARAWVLLLGLLFVLSLGPRLQLAGYDTGLPLPYELLRFIPGMTLGHRPNHLVIFMLPLLAVLAGLGMRALLARGRAGRLALALLGAGIVLEYLVLPLPALPFDVHPAIAELRGQPGAVLELPPDRRSATAMNHQMVHGRPILGGYLAREPTRPPFIQARPWLRDLWLLQPAAEPEIVPQRTDTGWQLFHAYNIRTIVVRRSELTAQEDAAVQQAIARVLPGSELAYQDEALLIYQIAPQTVPRPFLYLGAGWQQREDAGGQLWRWLGARSAVQLVNPRTEAAWVTLELEAESYQQPRPLRLSLGSAQLGAFAIGRARETLRLHLVLPPGEHTLWLDSEPTRAGDPPRNLSLSFTRIELVDWSAPQSQR